MQENFFISKFVMAGLRPRRRSPYINADDYATKFCLMLFSDSRKKQ